MVSFDGVFVRGTAFRFVVIDGSGEGRVHHLTATATVTITSKIHEAVNEAHPRTIIVLFRAAMLIYRATIIDTTEWTSFSLS